MSLSNVAHTMTRIRYAAPESPIAVFLRMNSTTENEPMVNAVFASTMRTQRQIAAREPSFVGVYDGSMNLDVVESLLRRIAR